MIKSAFPFGEHPTFNSTGMSLRDYFAAKALPAIINARQANGNSIGSDESFPVTADIAYAYADAMLKIREE